MKKIISYLIIIVAFFALSSSSCEVQPSSDDVQRAQQEKILAEGTAAINMPAIKNFREKRILKDIIELRDQMGLITYTYIFSEMTGKYTYIGETIGYGIPCATQFTNPLKVVGNMDHRAVINQADPNGLFSPASAEGTWVMMLNPENKNAEPQYIESRISVFTYKLRPSLVMAGY